MIKNSYYVASCSANSVTNFRIESRSFNDEANAESWRDYLKSMFTASRSKATRNRKVFIIKIVSMDHS